MTLIFGLMGMMAAAAGPDDFTLTIPVSPETPEGRRLISIRAMEICGTRYPDLARYRFTGDERIAPDGTRSSSFEVHQQLTCSDAPPPAAQADAPAPADWQASPGDEAEARAATMAYFTAVDAGDSDRVYAMLNAGQREMETREARGEALRAFLAQAGRPDTHRIVALTWYVNPPSAPRPGIYVAADYERSYSGLLANCGYLVWYREGPGRYSLVREETGIIARGSVPDTPADLAQARALARCRAG